VDPHNIIDNFIQFSHSAGGSRARRNCVQLLWFASVWIFWIEKNSRLFKLKERSIM